MFCSQLAFSILETFWTSFGARFWITFGLIWASWGTLGTPSGPPRGLGRCSGHYPTPDCKTPCKTPDFRPPKIHKPGLAAKRKAHWNCSALDGLFCSALVSDLSVCQVSCIASGLASGLVWSLVWSSLWSGPVCMSMCLSVCVSPRVPTKSSQRVPKNPQRITSDPQSGLPKGAPPPLGQTR